MVLPFTWEFSMEIWMHELRVISFVKIDSYENLLCSSMILPIKLIFIAGMRQTGKIILYFIHETTSIVFLWDSTWCTVMFLQVSPFGMPFPVSSLFLILDKKQQSCIHRIVQNYSWKVNSYRKFALIHGIKNSLMFAIQTLISNKKHMLSFIMILSFKQSDILNSNKHKNSITRIN